MNYDAERTKWEDRACPCFFLGIDKYKSFILRDLRTRRVFYGADAKFYPTTFPYRLKMSPERLLTMDASIVGASDGMSNAPIIAPETVQADLSALNHQLPMVETTTTTPDAIAGRTRKPHERRMAPDAVEAIANASVNVNWTNEDHDPAPAPVSAPAPTPVPAPALAPTYALARLLNSK